MHETTLRERTWWARDGLEARDGRLTIAGRDAEELARSHGTPLFAYDLERAGEQADALLGALEAAGVPAVVRFALKAQRDPAFLSFLRRRAPFVGMDVCSPGELEWSLEHGWAARGDQLHRHEPFRCGPRTHPSDGRPPQRRPAVPARTGGEAGSRRARRHPGQPQDRGHPRRRRREHLRGSQAHQVRHLPGAPGRRARDRAPPRPHDRHRPRAFGIPLLQRLPRRGRRDDRPPRHRHAHAPRCRLPDHRGQHRRRPGSAVPPDGRAPRPLAMGGQSWPAISVRSG